MAQVLARQGQTALADAAFADALSSWRQLLKDHPSDPQYRCALGDQLNQWALVLRDRSELAKAVEYLEEAVALQTRALEIQPHSLGREAVEEDRLGLGVVSTFDRGVTP